MVKYPIVLVCFFCLLPSNIAQKVKPDKSEHFDTCVGQCSFEFVETLKAKIGPMQTIGLLELDFTAVIKAFSNSTFFQGFCRIYADFRTCHNACPLSYLRELLKKSSEIVDLYCVENYDAIIEKLGCLNKTDADMSAQCLKSCTPFHDGVTALLKNFNRLALDGDSSQAEADLGQSCEYVTCSLHCDTPSIAFTCGYDAAELVINVTRETFAKIEMIALGTGAIAKWPAQCADIANYSIPTPPPLPDKEKVGMITDNVDQEHTHMENNQSISAAPVHEHEHKTHVPKSATHLQSPLLVISISISMLTIALFCYF